MSADLVLGTADGYRWEHVRAFVESLRGTGYDGEICLFGRVDDDTRAKLAAADVEVVRPFLARLELRGTEWHPYNVKTTRLRWHVQPLYRPAVRALSFLARDRERLRRRLTAAISNVDVARYFWYRELLAARRGRYRNVMLTDVRDVLFLGTPFDFDIGEEASFFLEADGATIDSQVNNRAWIIGAYGLAALDELGSKPISCSGITIGAAPAIEDYLAGMTDELMRLERQYRGMDQGVHNFLVHTGRVPGRLVANTEGPVLTVGVMAPSDAVALLNDRAEELRVIHQYDRHPALAAPLEELTHAQLERR